MDGGPKRSVQTQDTGLFCYKTLTEDSMSLIFLNEPNESNFFVSTGKLTQKSICNFSKKFTQLWCHCFSWLVIGKANLLHFFLYKKREDITIVFVTFYFLSRIQFLIILKFNTNIWSNVWCPQIDSIWGFSETKIIPKQVRELLVWGQTTSTLCHCK